MLTAAALVALVTGLMLAGDGPPQRRQVAAPAFAGVLDEHPAIQYATRVLRDPVALLDRALAAGQATLPFDDRGGYLRATLTALAIPPESQVLVFSRTGLQRAHTGPANPRALYFNDRVVVGFIPGARFLEIASHDPEQGVQFYTLDQEAREGPAIARGRNCLTCHVSSVTLEVPGMIARSNFVDRQGQPLPQLGSHAVTHRTPLTDRWGGWFVSGRYDVPAYNGTAHLGNVVTALRDATTPIGTSNEPAIAWAHSDPVSRGYLSAESDVAALMVFDHQMHGINLVTRVGWEARVAASHGAIDVDRPPLAPLIAELADYLSLAGVVPPPPGMLPREGLREAFIAGGRSAAARARRARLFDGPFLQSSCSYLLDSDAYAALPAVVKEAVARRLREC